MIEVEWIVWSSECLSWHVVDVDMVVKHLNVLRLNLEMHCPLSDYLWDSPQFVILEIARQLYVRMTVRH